MDYLAVIVVAIAHWPTAEDFTLFGLPCVPSCVHGIESPVRKAWKDSAFDVCVIRRAMNGYDAYGREDHYRELLRDAEYRSVVWYWLDDLCDSSRPESVRRHAAHRLREIMGPLAYWRGDLP